MYSFTEVRLADLNIDEYYSFKDKTVFTTVPWLNYLLEDTPGAEPILVRIVKDNELKGYFTGMKVKKAGIGILGSPFRGWSTCFMGLDAADDVQEQDRIDIYREIVPLLMKTHQCRYMCVSDRALSLDESRKHFRTASTDTLELNIKRTDEELFKVFKTDCRNFIRQFERRGAALEIAKPDDMFAEEFYQQLIDVFDKQGLNPTYSLEKVKRLLKNLSAADMVLCLRVRDPEGKSIASSIYPGYKNKFFFWGGASYRSSQHYRPNEYMIWSAIKYWRERGAEHFDMVGVRDYKKKFGPEEVHYATLEFANPSFLIGAKNLAEKLYFKSLGWRHREKKEQKPQ